MAEFYGPKGSNRWHTRPTMYGEGTIDAGRDGNNPSQINLHLVAYMSTRSGSSPSSCTSCRILASDGWASSYYELTDNYAREGSIDIYTSYTTNSAVTFYVHYYCCDGSSYDEPHCTSADGDQSDVEMAGTVSVGDYNPWTDPTPGRNVSCNPNPVKPDTTVTISWTAGIAGTGNSIGYYSVNYNRYRNRKLVRKSSFNF